MSGSDRRERTVLSVLNGQSVLFYHCRYGIQRIGGSENQVLSYV